MLRSLLHALAALCATMALVGCQKTVQTPLPTGPSAYETIAVASEVMQPQTYVLRTGDTVSVDVFREDDFSVPQARIDNSGNVYVPGVGEVRAAGRTQSQLAQTISDALGARYLRDPMVTVAVTEAALNTVSVEGEVEQPGVFEIRPGYTLLSAVALARSPTERAKLDEVLIFRQIDGQRVGGRFDLAEIRSGVAPDPLLVSGDVVVVGYSRARGAYEDFLQTAPLFNIFTRY